jgi:hypothetical protein
MDRPLRPACTNSPIERVTEGAAHRPPAPIQDVCEDLRRAHVLVPELFLLRADVHAALHLPPGAGPGSRGSPEKRTATPTVSGRSGICERGRRAAGPTRIRLQRPAQTSFAETFRVPLAMEQNEAPHPMYVGLLRADAVVAHPDGVSYAVQEGRRALANRHPFQFLLPRVSARPGTDPSGRPRRRAPHLEFRTSTHRHPPTQRGNTSNVGRQGIDRWGVRKEPGVPVVVGPGAVKPSATTELHVMQRLNFRPTHCHVPRRSIQ